jgi:hypothetical protein
MDKSTALSVGWHIPGGRIFEAFDDGLHSAHYSALQWCVAYSLSTTIMPHDHGQGGIEFDNLNMFIVE